MNERTLTDSQLSHTSNEYEWTTAGHAEAHTYLLPPVLELLRHHGAHKVLDLGCGNGSMSAAINARGFAVTGVDYSASGVAAARLSFPALHFEQQDLSEPLPAEYEDAYDAVVSTEVIEHMLLPRRLVANALFALRPGGLLVVSTPFHGYIKNLTIALLNGFDAHWHPMRDFGHIKFFSKATLRSMLAECELAHLQIRMAGRFYPLSKSMLASGVKTP
jgi:2-polyprenyl-6-hydroxyphenyl methylase/3-demethylubiquinone-9 3-methyltransferase